MRLQTLNTVRAARVVDVGKGHPADAHGEVGGDVAAAFQMLDAARLEADAGEAHVHGLPQVGAGGLMDSSRGASAPVRRAQPAARTARMAAWRIMVRASRGGSPRRG